MRGARGEMCERGVTNSHLTAAPRVDMHILIDLSLQDAKDEMHRDKTMHDMCLCKEIAGVQGPAVLLAPPLLSGGRRSSL